MKYIKQLLALFIVTTVFNACTEEETSYAFQNVSAPENVQATFSIAQDDTGNVSVAPTANGVTAFEIYFGDADAETATKVNPGEATTHTYGEGVFNLRIVAIGATGLTSELNKEVIISFAAPTDLVIGTAITTNSLEVTVSPEATNATMFDVYFGDVIDEEPTAILVGENAVHEYAIAGEYTIRVVAKGAGAATLEGTKEVTLEAPNTASAADFIGTWKMASEAGSLGVGPGIGDISWFAIDDQGVIDRACYFDDAYVFGADGSFMNILGVDTWIEGWQGGSDGCGVPVAPHNGSIAATYIYDESNGTVTLTGEGAYLGVPKANNEGELPNVAVPATITYNASLSEDKNTMNVYIESGAGVFWQYKLVRDEPSPIIGTWVMASEAGSLGVGPSVGDTSWFAIDDQGVIDRACYFDDTYVFGVDGSFMNILGADTWIEGWQGGSDACGAPVAPHDGATSATYMYDSSAGTVTISGSGAYVGIPKANNEGELPNVAVPASITYTVSFSNENNTMNIYIEAGAGVFWQYKLVRYVAPAVSPISGTWKMASEAGSLGVGPSVGDTSWFAIDDQGVIDRACYFDDTFVFGTDGSFMNVLGADTWVEGWQGGSDACGAPVIPHDGSSAATYFYDETNETITITGAGAYIGIPKANNDGELPNVAVPSTITYNVTLTDNNSTMNVYVEAGAGVFWQYKLVKE
ncbi:hypothetical protein CLV91_2513 [Maribacter vaceletii]|uniref:PKD/Chitinase domain-containing protein n=1 Tax=Maribacter vaceletii TaxID=1206816 RepID=A0A495E6H4_9FLAO|nr:hypothetical protein [Maribacter vaceletii]RKR12386.1 hypothetical protein CLV91_2513 [Maribacter vaceletii]